MTNPGRGLEQDGHGAHGSVVGQEPLGVAGAGLGRLHDLRQGMLCGGTK
jgi:hypothetical protein